MAIIPNQWESIHDPERATDHGRPHKARIFGRLLKLARPLRCMVHRRGAVLAAQGKDKKMANETSNLFNRRDTFFGICEAVGQDFGFNPLWLRLAFVAPLFFFPVQTFIGYFALGGVVLASRLLFPAKSAAPAAPALAAVETTAETSQKTEEFALAA
ncbi:PspC domain-containing protein [Sphingopyxis sp. EG6]|uniref:PspC domain-containing protein n=1 Tax=Sphingopyxis sp. EG6 TaxID=1874061 RepID=UPI001E2EEB73|nr:PspC domain-containing protein [Sphingopyxis sp. EG6]